MRRPYVCGPLSLAIFTLLLSGPAPAADLLPYHSLDPEPKVIALTPGVEGEEFVAILDRVEAAGYHVPVAYVGAGLVLLDAPGLAGVLAHEPAVTEVLQAPARGRAVSDRRVGALLRWWNEGFDVPVLSPEAQAATGENVQICAGARPLAEVLAERGISARCAPFEYGTVHFAAGRVVVSMILPEYRGPNPSFWTEPEVVDVTSELQRALGWWNLKSGRRVQFVLVDHGKVQTRLNPAGLIIGEELEYIESCLLNLGYDNRCGYTQVHDLNQAMQAQYRGHFSTTQFILHSNNFPGSGALAYAYIGGPHTVALLGNGGRGTDTLDRTIAHEFGHIFQAWDEYNAGGSCPAACNAPAGYLNAPNNNCVVCPTADTKCVMRGSGEYTAHESANMEQYINPCHWTKGAAGLWDRNSNGIIDVMETRPETVIHTVMTLADTLESSDSVAILGEAWDRPYPAPPRYANPVTINAVRNVSFRISGGPWNQARATDGFWSETREEFEIRLPELGGGAHSLEAVATNTVGLDDESSDRIQFFVYDVRLRKELEIRRDGAAFALSWAVDGEDFNSTYTLHRQYIGGEERPIAELPAITDRFNTEYFYLDSSVEAGRDYVYRLEVDIPRRGRKPLGSVRMAAVLAAPPAGTFVTIAPNPSRAQVLFSVTVPKGPTPGVDDIILPPGGSPGAGNLGERDGDGSNGGAGPGGARLWRDAQVAVYDIQGRLVRDLGTARHQELDTFNMEWDGKTQNGRRAPTGVYFLRIDLGYTGETKRIVLMR